MHRLCCNPKDKEAVMLKATVSLFVVVPVLVASLGPGVGTATAQDNRPHTELVEGTFTASPVNVRQRTCEGEDGTYLELRGQFAGTVVSADPRLSGDLEFMAQPALINLVTGLGSFQGPFEITDPATGRRKGRGEFFTVVTEGSLTHGFAVGKLIDQDGGPADNFFANLKSTLDAALNVAGQFGGTGDSRTPAVVQGGHCSGRFTRTP
jgi:hypothetical protein